MSNDDFTGWASPSEASGHRAAELIGELVALRPVEPEKTMKTEMGESAVRWAEALIIDPETGDYRNLGQMPIFWQVIRRQLNDGRPWLVGHVEQEGRAFVLKPHREGEEPAIRKALERHGSDDRKPVEEEPGEAPF